MKVNKLARNQLLIVSAIAMVATLIPVAAQARRGADDGAGHVRQEDKKVLSATSSSTKPQSITSRVDDNPSASDQAVLSQTSSNSNTPSTSTAATTTQTTTTMDQAIAKAKATFPEKTVSKVEKETEEGVLVYSVRFTDGSRVDVSVATGEITRIRDKAAKQNDDKDKDDDKDDDKDEDDSSDDSNESDHGSDDD